MTYKTTTTDESISLEWRAANNLLTEDEKQAVAEYLYAAAHARWLAACRRAGHWRALYLFGTSDENQLWRYGPPGSLGMWARWFDRKLEDELVWARPFTPAVTARYGNQWWDWQWLLALPVRWERWDAVEARRIP